MKKGFTLIEVLAVIVILGLLIAIISPVVNNLLGDSEDVLSDKQVDSIVKASKKYMVEHSELLPEKSDSTAIYISDLIDKGIIDSDNVIDPKTKEEMNGCVVVNYNENFNQYEYNYRDDCTINITFDPDGGSVDTTSKKVMIGKPYGELPTPTRDGYVFKGWRGKNMFDIDKIIISNYNNWGILIYNDYFTIEHKNGYSGGYPIITFDNMKNGKYIFSGDNLSYIGLRVNDNYVRMIKADPIIEKKGDEVIKISMYPSEYTSVTYSNIQLEEGEIATEFEPYQEFTSDTVVNKGSDYVMHAIWEVAS